MRFWVCFESSGSQDFLMDWCGSAAADKKVAKVLGQAAGERKELGCSTVGLILSW